MENQTTPTSNSPASHPLPSGWQQTTDESGARCFRNHDINITTYYDPRLPNPHPDNFAPTPVGGTPLPSGWEAVRQPGGPVFYLNHNTHSATRDDPRSSGAEVEGSRNE